jgi:hypothetical protein
MNSLSPILFELARPGSYLVYNTLTKQASLYAGYLATGWGKSVSILQEDLLALFEKAWIARYDSILGEHRYRLTEAGRKASRE